MDNEREKIIAQLKREQLDLNNMMDNYSEMTPEEKEKVLSKSRELDKTIMRYYRELD
jgi:hypothetical protein